MNVNPLNDIVETVYQAQDYARKRALEHPIHSEEIEPFAAIFIGRMWARCEKAKEKGRYEYEDALNSLWYGLYGLERIAIAARTATHFSLAMNNHIIFISSYIKSELGIDPTTEPGWKW